MLNENVASNPGQTVQIDVALLTELVVKLFQRKGMFAAEAEIVAKRMADAEEASQATHGFSIVSRYLDAMDLGEIDPRAKLATVLETSAMSLLDGNIGMGHVAATKGMVLAITKAREVGSATVVIRNSRQCGDVGAVAQLAADSGMIGFVTNSELTESTDGVEGHAVAWSIPASSGSTPIVVREHTSSLKSGASLVMGLLSAGLAGGESMARKRKASPTANVVEHHIQVIDPEKFGGLEAMLAKWHEPISLHNAQTHENTNTTDVGRCFTVSNEVASELASLAAKIKFVVNW